MEIYILYYGNHDTDARIKEYEKCENIKSIQYAHRIKYKKWMFYLMFFMALVVLFMALLLVIMAIARLLPFSYTGFLRPSFHRGEMRKEADGTCKHSG